MWTVGAGPVSAQGTDIKHVQVKISETEYLTNVIKISAGTNEILALTKTGEVYTYNINDEYASHFLQLTSNIVDISAGNNIFSALDEDGNVYTWTDETEPTKQKIENIIRISEGFGNIGALESNGLLWTWGENAKGQLGLNCKTNLEYPLAVTTNVTEISSGGTHTIIEKTDKKLYGTGDMYQTATFEEIALPETVTDLNPVKYFKTGYNTTTIMLKDGKVYGEGGNTKGELGIGTTENATRFTQGLTFHDLPLTSVLTIGRNIGGLNSTAILENGDIYTTGDNTNGQIGDGTNENKTYYTKMEKTSEVEINKKNEYIKIGEKLNLDILGGIYNFNVFVNNDETGENINQTGWTWSSSNDDVATIDENGVVTGISVGYTTITAYNEATGLKGRAIINVYRNKEGAITVPQVSHGEDFTVVLKEDGTVWASGQNNLGQLGDGTNTNKNEPVQVRIDENTYLTNVRKISVGTEWATALTLDGKVYTWGYNRFGQLAQGDTANLLYAKQAKIDENTYIGDARDISAGDAHLMVVANDGRLYVSGNNNWYQNLTTGKEEMVPYLTDTGLNSVIKVNAGYSTCCAMLSNGKTLAWGHNGYGELETNGNPTLQYVIAEDAVDIRLNAYYTIIQKENREIYVTGRNDQGQLGLGDYNNRNVLTKVELPKNENGNNEQIKYISGTADNIMLMTKEGKVYVSGYNGYGQLCTGDTTDSNTFIPLVNKDGSIVTDALLLEEDAENGNFWNNNRGLSFIRKDGTVWMSGDNSFGQMGKGTNTSTNYLVPMGYTELDYEDKEIILDETGYQIDINKLKYIETLTNVYNDNEPLKVGKLEYTSSDETLATVNENGFITPKKSSGTAEITIKDIDNKCETKITVLVNRLLVDTDTVTYIYNIEDLVKFRDSVNAGNDYAGKTVYVMADIDMSTHCSEALGVSWTPIGATGTAFAGTFDGNYHTLSNLYYNSNRYTNVGLFANNSGTIENIILDNVYIYAVRNGTYDTTRVGGVVGTSSGSIINSGVNSGSIAGYNNTAITSSWRVVYVGGIVGSTGGRVISCYNKADITCQNYNAYSGCTSGMGGGIIGSSGNTYIESCYNTGKVNTIARRAHSGGIIGDQRRCYYSYY